MGRSFLQKAIAGAATMGASLLSEDILATRKAEIAEKRMRALESYRSREAEEERAFRASQQENLLESRESVAKMQLEAQQNSPQQVLASMKIEEREKLQQLAKKYASADSKEEQEKIRKEMNALRGIVGDEFVAAGSRIFNKTAGEYIYPEGSDISIREKAASIAANRFANQQVGAATFDELFEDTLIKLQGDSSDGPVDEKEGRFKVKKIYEDKNGVRARYLGNGKWEPI